MAKDEFDWEDFDDDEFFDDYSKILGDDLRESKSDKVGIKSFFKNTVKSVGRGVVKLGKAFMPEATDALSGFRDFGSETKDNLAGSKDKIIKEITGKKMEEIKFSKSIADTFSNAKKDILERVKTGNFVKDESEIDFNSFMDDEDEEDDDDEYSESYSPEEQQEVHFSGLDDDYKPTSVSSNKGSKSYKQIIIQKRIGSDKKAAKAVLATGEASVRAQYELFNKSSLMAESRHNQMMTYMRNMMKNIYTLTASNSTLLKVQMEFGRKNLAMIADMLGLFKEIHQYQTKLYGKSLKEADDSFNDSDPKNYDIFGNGFNGSEYFKKLKNNLTYAFQDSMVGTLWETMKMNLEMQSAMGGKKKGMVGNMISMIDPTTVFGNLLFGNKVKEGFEQMNKLGKALPQLINNKLLKIASTSNNSIISTIASLLGVRDQSNSLDFSNEINGRDLKAPSVWDNQSWATLNEVIPGLLSQIAAGITGREQVYYDYENSEFKTISSMQKKFEKNEEVYYHSDFNMTEKLNNLTTNALKNVEDKDKVRFSNGIETIFKAIVDSGEDFDEKRVLVDENYRDLITEKIKGSEAEKKIILMKFIQAYSKMTPEDKMSFNIALGEIKTNVEEFRSNYTKNSFHNGNTWAVKMWSRERNITSLDNQIKKIEYEQKKIDPEKDLNNIKKTALHKRKLELINKKYDETLGVQDIINKETFFSDFNEQKLNDSFSSSNSLLQKMVHMFSRGIPVFTIRPTKKLLNEYKMISDHMIDKVYDKITKENDKKNLEKLTLEESMESIIEMQKTAKANKEMLKSFGGLDSGFDLSNTKIGNKINQATGALLTLGVQGLSKFTGYKLSGEEYNYIPEDPEIAFLMMQIREQEMNSVNTMVELEELKRIDPLYVRDKNKIERIQEKLLDLKKRRDEIAVKIENNEEVDPKIQEQLNDELLVIQWEISQMKGKVEADYEKKKEKERLKNEKFWQREDIKRKNLYEKDLKAKERFETKHANDKGFIKKKYKHSKAFKERFKNPGKIFKKSIADIGYDKVTWIKPVTGIDKVGYVWTLVSMREVNEVISILTKNNFGYGSIPTPETNAIYISPEYMKMSGTDVDPLEEWEDEVESKIENGVKLFLSIDQLKAWSDSDALYDVSDATKEFNNEKTISYVERLKNKKRNIKRDKIIESRIAQGLDTDEKSIDEAMNNIKKKRKIKGATLTDVLAAQLSTKNTLLKGFAALTNRNEEDFDDKKTSSLEALVNANPIGNVSVNLDNTVASISAGKDGPEKWVKRELTLLEEMNNVLSLIYSNTLGMNGKPVDSSSWEILDKIKKAGSAAWGHVKTFGKGTIDFLKNMDIGGVGKGVLDILGSAGSLIFQKLGQGASWLKDKGIAGAAWLKEKITGEKASQLKDKFNEGKNWLGGKLDQTKTKITQWKDEVLDPKLAEIHEKYGKKFIFKLNKEDLKPIVARILKLPIDAKEIVFMKVSEMREIVQKYYEENIEWRVSEFKEKTSQLKDKAKEKGKGLIEGVKGFFAGLLGLGKDTASALFDGAKGFFGNLNLGETFKNFSLFGGRRRGLSSDMYLKGILQNTIATRIILGRQFGHVDMNSIAYDIDKMDNSSTSQQSDKVGLFKTTSRVLTNAVNSTIKGAGSAIESFQANRALRKENQISKSVEADGFSASEHGDHIREGSREDMIKDKEVIKEKELKEDTRNLLAVIAANTSIQMDLLKSQAIQTKENIQNSKFGQAVTTGLTAIGGTALSKKVTGAIGKITGKFFNKKAGQEVLKAGVNTVSKTASKVGAGVKGAMSGGLKGLVKGGLSVATSPFRALGGMFSSSVTKTALEAGTKVGDLVLKAVSFILGKFFKNNTIIKKIGQGPLTKIKSIVFNTIKKHLSKIVAKVAPKMGIQAGVNVVPGLGQAAWVAWKIADAVIGFTLGYKNAGKHWGVSNSTKLSHNMKTAAGLASALDMCLWGILGLIGDLVSSGANTSGTGLGYWIQMIYQLMGNDTTNLKASQNWAKVRTTEIYGIAEQYQDGFFNYEQAWVKVPMWHMHGCGFRKVKSFNYWVENRYKPLKEIEESIAKKYGGSKIIHQMDPEGNDELEAIASFRKEFYSEAMSYIKKMKIGWIVSGITSDDIKKHEQNKKEDALNNINKEASRLNAKQGENTSNSENPEESNGKEPGTQKTNNENSNLNKENTINKSTSDLSKEDQNSISSIVNKTTAVAGVKNVGSGQQVKTLSTTLTTEDGRIRLVLKNEGGYCNVQGDSGGPTNYGIAWNYNKSTLKNYGITDPSQMRNLDINIAIDIYKKNYYKPCGAANIKDPVLAVHVFDCAVNCGVGRAKQMLAEANKHKNPRDCFIQLRYNYYRSISAKKSSLRKFLKGWLARIKHTNDALGYVYTEGSLTDEPASNNNTTNNQYTQNTNQVKANGEAGHNGTLSNNDENAIAKMQEMANSSKLSDIASENGLTDEKMMGMNGEVVANKNGKNGKLTKSPAQHFEDALITELDHLKALVDGQKEQTQAIVTPLVALQATMAQAVELLSQIANSGSGNIGNPAIANVIARGQ